MEEEDNKATTPKDSAPKPLSESDILARVSTAFPHTSNYTQGVLETKRLNGLELYNRDAFAGDEQIVGRSRYVTDDVFVSVEWTLATLMSLFDSQDRVVQFSPTGPEDEPLAEQQTDVVNYVLTQGNSNAKVLHDWLKNGLIGGLGVVTAEFYKDKRWKPAQVLEGVPDHHAVELENSEDHEILEAGEPYAIPGMEHIPGMDMRDLKVRKSYLDAGVRIRCLPPEDFFVSRDAQFDYQTGGIDAALQGFKRTLPRAELVEMGYDAAKVTRIPASGGDHSSYALERNRDQGFSDGTNDVEAEVDLYEIFMRLDANGDGVRELLRLTIGGTPAGGAVLLGHEEVELAPFAAFVPYMMPNTLNGMSTGDLVGKDQRLKSMFMRGINDNLTQVLRPQRIADVEGVNIDDLLNSGPDSIIRVKDKDALSYATTPFVGGQAFGMIDQINQSVEHRMGVGPNLMGVDPSQLQNTTATASSQRQTMSQLRLEMIARLFAETGYRYLFRMVTSLLVANMEHTQALTVKLRGNWVPYGTDQWNPDLDIKANITFGITDKPQKLAALSNILSQQMTAMQQGAPITDMGKIYNTLALIAENSGFKNAERFWNDPAKMPPGAAQPPDKPDPKAQAEQAKMQADIQRAQAQLQLDREKMQAEIQLEREKFQAHMELERYKAEQELELRRQEVGAETQLKGLQIITKQNAQPQIPNPQ
ncbi:hypothetical protein [Methylobacterium sp. SD21]|uniref:portal protein n=1 Tax=Methylobacterium litchii TaxID=3138810 RepID=UPI00313C74A3